MIIDISQIQWSPKIYAKRIWVALLKETEAWKWANLDDFICDMDNIENMIKNHYQLFYWEYNTTGHTEIKLLKSSCIYNPAYEIIIDRNIIIITRIK